MSKLTIHDLFAAKKSSRTFTEIRTSNLNEALACAQTGVEMIMCMEERPAGNPPGGSRRVHRRRPQRQ